MNQAEYDAIFEGLDCAPPDGCPHSGVEEDHQSGPTHRVVETCLICGCIRVTDTADPYGMWKRL